MNSRLALALCCFLTTASLCAILFPTTGWTEIVSPQGSAVGTQSTIDLCAPPRLFQYGAGVQAQGNCAFVSRFRQTLAVDVRALGSTHELTRTSNHRVNFQVVAPGPWEVVVEHRRRGTLLVRQDSGKCGRAELSNVSVIPTGNFSLSNSLDTTTDYAVCNCDNCLTECHFGDNCSADQGHSHSVAVNDAPVQATLTGSGTQFVTLDFSWTATVESQANLAGGGDEAIVRMGVSADENSNWLENCDGIIDGAVYSPTGQDGHFVTVTLVSDQAGPPTVVLDGEPSKCSPLSGSPCTYFASGTVLGCLGDNYTVFIEYVDANGNIVCTDTVVITNGNSSWVSELTCPGACTAVAANISASNDPGKVFVAGGQPPMVRSPVVVASNGCNALSYVPALGIRSLAVAVCLMIALGTSIVLKHRRHASG